MARYLSFSLDLISTVFDLYGTLLTISQQPSQQQRRRLCSGINIALSCCLAPNLRYQYMPQIAAFFHKAESLWNILASSDAQLNSDDLSDLPTHHVQENFAQPVQLSDTCHVRNQRRTRGPSQSALFGSLLLATQLQNIARFDVLLHHTTLSKTYP